MAATRREGSAGETAGLKGHPRSFLVQVLRDLADLAGCRKTEVRGCGEDWRAAAAGEPACPGRTGEMIGLVSDT